jgi:hypothetical protein
MEAWIESRAHGSTAFSIWTDGESVFSYQTCLLAPARELPSDRPVLNMTKYSPTTSQQQQGIRLYLSEVLEGYAELDERYVIVDDAPRGISREKLQEYGIKRREYPELSFPNFSPARTLEIA